MVQFYNFIVLVYQVNSMIFDKYDSIRGHGITALRDAAIGINLSFAGDRIA